jgi:hypothetical protein
MELESRETLLPFLPDHEDLFSRSQRDAMAARFLVLLVLSAATCAEVQEGLGSEHFISSRPWGAWIHGRQAGLGKLEPLEP